MEFLDNDRTAETPIASSNDAPHPAATNFNTQNIVLR